MNIEHLSRKPSYNGAAPSEFQASLCRMRSLQVLASIAWDLCLCLTLQLVCLFSTTAGTFTNGLFGRPKQRQAFHKNVVAHLSNVQLWSAHSCTLRVSSRRGAGSLPSAHTEGRFKLHSAPRSLYCSFDLGPRAVDAHAHATVMFALSSPSLRYFCFA